MEEANKKNSGGGMYRGVNFPVRLLDFVITIGISAIFLLTVLGAIK